MPSPRTRRNLAALVATALLVGGGLLAGVGLGGCRKATPGFGAKANVAPADVARIVLYADDPRRPGLDPCYFESADPALIAATIEGLRTSSRAGGREGIQQLDPLFLVPKSGKPLYFGVTIQDAEDWHGARLAHALAELMSGPSITEGQAWERDPSRFVDLRRLSR